MTLDVMEMDFLNQFLNDLTEIVADIHAGKIDREGLLSYGGVANAETAPKWLLSAVEIMEKASSTEH